MQEIHVQTKQEVRAVLDAAGLRPDKRFGQNFLIDGNLMRKLVVAADVSARDTVLEVGGGTGGLTDLLAARAGRVIVVEIDRGLAPLLEQRFADREHVTVLTTDVLTNKSTISGDVLDALTAAEPEASPDGKYMLVANLPYNIATPLLMNLLTSRPVVQRFCFTIQKEVAERITAHAGTKEFGPLAIALQTTCEIRKVARLPGQAFWPAPKIESTMLRLDRKPHPFEQGDALDQFLDLIHAAFAHRRKTLRYNLAKHLDRSRMVKAGETADLSARAEAVELHQWTAMGKSLAKTGL